MASGMMYFLLHSLFVWFPGFLRNFQKSSLCFFNYFDLNRTCHKQLLLSTFQLPTWTWEDVPDHFSRLIILEVIFSQVKEPFILSSLIFLVLASLSYPWSQKLDFSKRTPVVLWKKLSFTFIWHLDFFSFIANPSGGFDFQMTLPFSTKFLSKSKKLLKEAFFYLPFNWWNSCSLGTISASVLKRKL